MHLRGSAHHRAWKIGELGIHFFLHQTLKLLCCSYTWGFFFLKCLLTQFVHSSTTWEALMVVPGFVVSTFFFLLCIWGGHGLRRCHAPHHTSATSQCSAVQGISIKSTFSCSLFFSHSFGHINSGFWSHFTLSLPENSLHLWILNMKKEQAAGSADEVLQSAGPWWGSDEILCNFKRCISYQYVFTFIEAVPNMF